MTTHERAALAAANRRLADAGDAIAALAQFFRTTTAVTVSPETVHIVGDTAAYERLIKAAERLART